MNILSFFSHFKFIFHYKNKIKDKTTVEIKNYIYLFKLKLN